MKKLIHEEILEERLKLQDLPGIKRHPVYVMLYNVRSLYNVGSIFRTCDSALVSELILTGFTPYPPRQEIEKTALGAVDTVPWKYFKEPYQGINYIKNKSIKVFAVEITDKKRTYDSLTKSEYPLCLVLGNEINGIDNDIITQCDDAIEIPMYGVKHSLNVSVAAGITIFEAVRNYINIKEI